MIDLKKAEKKIQKMLAEEYNLGENIGGSGHLGYRSLASLNIENVKQIEREKRKIYEVSCNFKIYTETEFTHFESEDDDPDEVFHAEYYTKKILFDKQLNILKSQ